MEEELWTNLRLHPPVENYDAAEEIFGQLAHDGSEIHTWLSKAVKMVDLKLLERRHEPEERVEMLLECFRENRPMPKLEAPKSEKDMQKAMQLKAEGNQMFKENKFKEARDLYTKSLQHCPVNAENLGDNREFSIILANRAAALEAGRMWGACRQDILMAFKYGYPRNLQYKAYHRLGVCQLKLKQFKDAKEAFSKCLDMIGKVFMDAF